MVSSNSNINSNIKSNLNSNLKTIENFKKILAKDPNSKIFAALAEAQREFGKLDEAEATAQKGIARHPQYAGGYLALGRTLLDRQDFKKAVHLLKKATELDSQNLLAHQLLGTAFVQLKEPKEALKAFKMVLLLNPASPKARSAVEMLESLTADEYEEDIFKKPPPSTESFAEAIVDPSEITRGISLLDALIVRNDLVQARELLEQLEKRFPNDSRYESRWNLLLQSQAPTEEATPISPILSREKDAIQRKIDFLKQLLLKINSIDRA